MTPKRDIEGLLDVWLGEGSGVASERVLDTVADRILRQRQRGAWSLRTRRPSMNTQLRLAAVLAVLAILAVGATYVAGPPTVSTPTASPQPTTSTTPKVFISPAAGLRRVSSSILPPFTVDIPDSWEVWSSQGGGWWSVKKAAESGPFLAEITFWKYRIAEEDPAGCDGPNQSPIAPSAGTLIGALLSDPRFVTTNRGPVTVAGFSGLSVDVELSPAWTGTCVDSAGRPAASALSFVYLEAGDKHRLIVLDLRGTLLVIRINGPDAGTFDAALAEAMPIIRSLQFRP